MSDNESSGDQPRPTSASALGCAGTIAVINLMLMGLVASSFASGPFSSLAQMAWYRFGSMGFLSLGAVLPIAALLFAARRSSKLVEATTVWMLMAFLLFVGFLFYSGGGV